MRFELGLDVGFISAVCQVDPPATVNSIIQRTGRSGRSGQEPSILWLYVVDVAPMKGASLTQLLHPNLLQATAMIRLVIEGWLEPARGNRYDLSTLTHQILSLLKQRSELKPSEIYEILCQIGPFRKVDQQLFADVLRSLTKYELIEQEPEGKILLGAAGEKITAVFDFYAAFLTKIEYSVRHISEEIGRLPAETLPRVGEYFNLAARRWRADKIEHTNQVVEVSPAGVSKAPVFRNPAGDIHTRIYREMKAVLQDTTLPAWLNPEAQSLLQAARHAAQSAGLIHNNVLAGSSGILWFPWVGTQGQRTLELFAIKAKIKCIRDRLSLTFPGLSVEKFKGFLNSITSQPVDPVELAALMVQKRFEKFDRYLEPSILDQANAHDRLNVEDARQAAEAALKELGQHHLEATPE
jgi:ATP-dependent Lhr-like helicase